MTWWNPYNREGENPFEQFDSWEDFLNRYVTPENEIARQAGPGDVIQEGKWYITNSATHRSPQPVWNLSYMGGPPELGIKFVPFLGRPGHVRISENPNNWNWIRGYRDGWGTDSYHYPVDFDDVLEYNFINWRKDPWEVKG